jgi:hypothetical protein
VRTPAVVEGEVQSDPGLGFRHGVVGMQIDLFVLDRLPQPLDEHVVAPGTASVHADLDFVFCRTWMKLEAVNCEPWSVLKISGAP